MRIPSWPQVPLIFGGLIACGGPGDEWTGDNGNGALYGSASIRASFSLPSQESAVQVSVTAMIAAGSPPGELVFTLYDPTYKTVLATATLPASSVTWSSPAWTPFVTLAPLNPLAAGIYYGLVVTSPNSTSANYFRVLCIDYAANWWDPGTSAGYSPPPGYSYNAGGGSSVIWVKDPAGNDLELCPFGTSGDISLAGGGMIFTALSNYQINGIRPWLSDCYYMLPGTYGAAFVLTDLTTNQVVGSAPVSQLTSQTSHPPQFSSPVNIIAGHQYSITIQQTGIAQQNDVYGGLIRASKVSPPQASPNDSPTGAYWWGHLFNSDFTAYRVVDYGADHIATQGNSGGIGGLAQVTVRLVPAFSDTVTSVSLLMFDGNGTLGYYPAGTRVTISLYASNEAALSPTGSPLHSVTVDSGTIPYNGRLIAPVSWPVTANVPVWVVFSAPSAPLNNYVPDRCVSGWRYLSLCSGNGGSSWGTFGQGPTDLGVALEAPQGMIGSPYDGAGSFSLSPANVLAQPFILAQAGTLNALEVTANGNVSATVYPDNGAGAPDMKSPLGSGTSDAFHLGGVILFPNGVPLAAQTKYYIVYFMPAGESGAVALSRYWTRPADITLPAGYEAMVSANGGNSWSAPYSDISSIDFLVGLQPTGAPPPPPTPVPTTLTLTARAL